MYGDGEEAVEVLYGVLNPNSIEQNLQGIYRHIHNILVICAQLKHIDNLVNYRVFEIIVLTKIIFENYLYDSDEHHQLRLLQELVAKLIFLHGKLHVEGLQKANGEIRGLNSWVPLKLFVQKLQGIEHNLVA